MAGLLGVAAVVSASGEPRRQGARRRALAAAVVIGPAAPAPLLLTAERAEHLPALAFSASNSDSPSSALSAVNHPHSPLPSPAPTPMRADSPSDALLVQVEETLAEELERAQATGAALARFETLRARLLDVRAAREQARLAAALTDYRAELRHEAEGLVADDSTDATADSGGGARARMRRTFLQRLTQPLRFASPGVLGLLVNVLV